MSEHCSHCGATLPEEIDEGTGVYCTECGHGQLVTDGGTADPEVFEISVRLTQTATVSVRADSRTEAWEALQMPHDRAVDRLLAQTSFSEAEYEPEDGRFAPEIEDVDLDLTEVSE